MSYRIAVCDDSLKDAAYVQSILNSWASDRPISIQAEVFPSAESFLFRYAEDKAWIITVTATKGPHRCRIQLQIMRRDRRLPRRCRHPARNTREAHCQRKWKYHELWNAQAQYYTEKTLNGSPGVTSGALHVNQSFIFVGVCAVTR